MKPLQSKKILSLALNLPGPTACHRLANWGASVIKIEPLEGDPLNHYYPKWYQKLNSEQKTLAVSLKTNEGRQEVMSLIKEANLVITSQLTKTLEKFNICWKDISSQSKNTSLLQILGFENENQPGHDLNFQAKSKLLSPPQMPKTLVADMCGAERIVSTAIAMLMLDQPTHQKVFLSKVASDLAEPIAHGATLGKGPLSGHLPYYGMYECKDGWIALCALEPQFQAKVNNELGESSDMKAALKDWFKIRDKAQCITWGEKLGIPLNIIM